jgi:hypothetical protein
LDAKNPTTCARVAGSVIAISMSIPTVTSTRIPKTAKQNGTITFTCFTKISLSEVTRKPEIHYGGAQFDGTGGTIANTKKITEHELPIRAPGPGRPRTLDVVVEQRLQERLRVWLSGFRGDLPSTNSTNMKGAVRKYSEAEGVSPDCPWRLLRDRIVYPVLKKIPPRK